MKKIDVYTTNYCPYCVKAKDLLNKKGVQFTEIDVTEDQEMRVKLVEMSGGRKTVPQIFVDGISYGGFSDIDALDKEGKLDSIIG